MKKALSIGLLIAGAILLVYGIQASDSISSNFSNFFTGSPSRKSLWLLSGGAGLAVIGVSGILLGKNK